jgi:hypothetical protein
MDLGCPISFTGLSLDGSSVPKTKVWIWTVFSFLSATCRDTYGLPDSNFVRRDDEKRALCTSEFSDISPLTGGNVAFSTLEGRPSAYNFDESKELQVFHELYFPQVSRLMVYINIFVCDRIS